MRRICEILDSKDERTALKAASLVLTCQTPATEEKMKEPSAVAERVRFLLSKWKQSRPQIDATVANPDKP